MSGKLLGVSWTDDVTLTITSEAGTYVKANLQDLQPGRKWRSTTTADQVITADLGGIKEITGFVLYSHNLSVESDITFEIADTISFSNITYTTTFKGVAPLYGYGTQALGLYGIGGYSTEGIVQTFSTHWTTAAETGQAIRVTISDSTNADGYVEVGRLKVGYAVDVPISPGYSMGFSEQTTLTRTRGGALRSDNRPSYRWATIDTTLMDENEETRIMDLFNDVGRSTDVLWTAFPSDNTTRERRSTILGRVVSGGGSTITNEGSLAQFTIEEAL